MEEQAIDETAKAGFLLGWVLWQPAREKMLKTVFENESCRIVELKGKELLYCINLPELSIQEAGLLAEAFEEFKLLSNPEFEELNNLEFFFKEFCDRNLVQIDSGQEEYLLEILRLSAFGFGPLSRLLENESIEEIAITGLGKEKPVRVFDRKLGWLKTNFSYANQSSVKNAVNKMARRLGKRLSMQNPRLNAMLPDGSRLSCSIEPVSFLGPNVTIRKFGKKPFSPLDLAANKTATAEALAFLQIAFQTDSSVLIAGNTGSGKTSLLNALFCFVPENERIIAVEETPELKIMHEHLIKLNVSEGLNVGMKDLIIDSLRMRPDRVIVGEVRNSEEVLAFVDTMLAGQGKGSIF
ncbi:MAG: ATPase, T2SS/T4P/T4SS family [Candidatus Diapherotrites archaeon]|nr:ATPase, T2SS/T4P/T4SS family [Candidatus Diapherotrites archaeon]